MDLTRLEKTVIRHEGFKAEPYQDSTGHVTLGIGRKDARLSIDEALYLLRNDLQKALEAASGYYFFWHLNNVRQEVIIELIFNIGHHGFSKFKDMIAALEIHDYVTAANELLDSKWAIQVGTLRATNMAIRLKKGLDEERNR